MRDLGPTSSAQPVHAGASCRLLAGCGAATRAPDARLLWQEALHRRESEQAGNGLLLLVRRRSSQGQLCPRRDVWRRRREVQALQQWRLWTCSGVTARLHRAQAPDSRPDPPAYLRRLRSFWPWQCTVARQLGAGVMLHETRRKHIDASVSSRPLTSSQLADERLCQLLSPANETLGLARNPSTLGALTLTRYPVTVHAHQPIHENSDGKGLSKRAQPFVVCCLELQQMWYHPRAACGRDAHPHTVEMLNHGHSSVHHLAPHRVLHPGGLASTTVHEPPQRLLGPSRVH